MPRHPELTRREFLRATAAASALVGVGVAGCRSGSRDGLTGSTATPFQHGVASGDPLADRVMLWTRVSPRAGAEAEPIEVGWRVARDAALRDVVAHGEVLTDASRDFCVHVDAAGLEPGRSYYYAFSAERQASPIGRTRTLPSGSIERVRIASCSCSHYATGIFNAYAAIARRDDLDVVLHLGDYIYEYGNDGHGASVLGRVAEPAHEIVSLADYRTRYAQYRRDPDLQALHARHAMIAVWDDHEIANDAFRGGAQNHDVASEGSWSARRAAAVQAWREWMPARVADASSFDLAPQNWRAFRFGDLADLVMLDTRLAGRDMQAPRTDRFPRSEPQASRFPRSEPQASRFPRSEPQASRFPRSEPQASRFPRSEPQASGEVHELGRSLLGGQQEAWLFAQLAASKASGTPWRIVGQQVVFAPFARPPRPPNPDGWDGYPEARRRVLDHLASNRIDDVVILSGDVHSSWAFEVPADPFAKGSASRAVEFVAPAVSSKPLIAFSGMQERFADAPATLPHLRFMDLGEHGYVVLDLDRERARAEWWFVETVERQSSAERLGYATQARRGTSRLTAG
jgi:alkaline phosphatase D